MNCRQIIIMWTGIAVIMFICIIAVVDYQPFFYEAALIYAAMVALLTVGFVFTLKDRPPKRKYNIQKGLKRFALVLSIILFVGWSCVGAFLAFIYEDIDSVTIGLSFGFVSFVVTWAAYFLIFRAIAPVCRWIADGFEDTADTQMHREDDDNRQN